MAPSDFSFVINPFTVVGVGVLLYGVYLAFFCSALYLLFRRPGSQRQHTFHVILLVLLFLFATVALVLDIVGSAKAIILTFQLNNGEITTLAEGKGIAMLLNIMEEVNLLLYSTANAAADAILLYRLYAVWGFRKRVIIAPVIISVLNNALAILDAVIRIKVVFIVDGPQDQALTESDIFWMQNTTIMTLSFMVVNLVVNTLVTCLIAGRIWWISRTINISYGRNGAQKKYKRVVAIILESGIIYPVAILVALLSGQLIPHCPSLFAILTEVVGIAPTLIIVRVAMGVNVDVVEQTAIPNSGSSFGAGGANLNGKENLSALRFAPANTTTSTANFTSVVDLRAADEYLEDEGLKNYRRDWV